MVQMIQPKLGESIADFACGTGGFLTSALKVLDAQVDSVEDRAVYSSSVYGIEKKALPFLLCATNMLRTILTILASFMVILWKRMYVTTENLTASM